MHLEAPVALCLHVPHMSQVLRVLRVSRGFRWRGKRVAILYIFAQIGLLLLG